MAPPQQDAHFAHRVIAVPGCLKSQQQQQQPTLIHHCFNFDARYNTSASVLFRLSNHPTIITTSNNNNNKASKPIIFYLQITPDRIESVTKTTHEKQADNAPELELDIVRGQLGRVSDVTSLEFKLHSHGDLITPTDFDLDDCDDDQVRRDLASFKSFASALVFSLYMPHNVLRREHWRTFKWAVTQSASLTDGQRSELERMADIRSLYHGKGGALLSPGNEEEEEATSRSCATTEVVDTPSAYASPPPYDDNGERNRVQSGGGGTSKYVDRPAASGAPPKYNRTEEPNQSSSSFINGTLIHCEPLPHTLKKTYATCSHYNLSVYADTIPSHQGVPATSI